MYHCGPTVYDYAHIGNLRSYIFADLLRRSFEYFGYNVEQVINITDIGHLTSDADAGDDKMVKGLKREGLPLSLEGLKQLADKYERAFKEDLEKLNIETRHRFPRATEYLQDEIDLIKKLEEKGFTYELPDGIYFDTSKLSDYGKLGSLTPLDESKSRVDEGGKKSPRDFVLWKRSQDNHLGFESPWGVGFPGWHIECSAMSRKLLGQPFDIHTGGIDHIPVHHNNEIAQSEAAYDIPLANFWLHNEFVTIADSKMAKSENNFITLQTLTEKGFSPLAYRYFLLQSHYRTPTNFSFEALEAAQNAYRKLKNSISKLNRNTLRQEVPDTTSYKLIFKQALEDDLNTPQALAIMYQVLNDYRLAEIDKFETILDFDKVLGLKLEENEFAVTDIPQEVNQLLIDRDVARLAKNWSKADHIREKLRVLGYEVSDTDSGQTVRKI